MSVNRLKGDFPLKLFQKLGNRNIKFNGPIMLTVLPLGKWEYR